MLISKHTRVPSTRGIWAGVGNMLWSMREITDSLLLFKSPNMVKEERVQILGITKNKSIKQTIECLQNLFAAGNEHHEQTGMGRDGPTVVKKGNYSQGVRCDGWRDGRETCTLQSPAHKEHFFSVTRSLNLHSLPVWEVPLSRPLCK